MQVLPFGDLVSAVSAVWVVSAVSAVARSVFATTSGGGGPAGRSSSQPPSSHPALFTHGSETRGSAPPSGHNAARVAR